ncbi:MAG: TetR/AcrR family transcriptional regulator [Stackebrandtia sp.]
MPKKPLGRPRDERVDEKLRTAVLVLLAEVGYGRLTVDAVAARAGVGKPAIYRRFRSKAELVYTLAVHDLDESAAPDAGSLRADLAVLTEEICEMVGRAELSVSSLIADVLADPELAERFRGSFLRVQRDVVAELLRRARDRGEIAVVPDTAATHALILGPIFVRLVIAGEPMTPRRREAHVDATVRALGAA